MLLGCSGEDFPEPGKLPLPDLTIISASVSPTSASPGSLINITCTVMNIGDHETSERVSQYTRSLLLFFQQIPFVVWMTVILVGVFPQNLQLKKNLLY